MPDEDAPALLDRLSVVGINDMLNTLEQIQAGDCAVSKQAGASTFRAQLKKEIGRIDWGKTGTVNN